MAKRSKDNTKIYNPSAKTPDTKMNDYSDCNNGMSNCNNGVTDCHNGASDCNNSATDCNNSVSSKKRNKNKDIPSFR